MVIARVQESNTIEEINMRSRPWFIQEKDFPDLLRSTISLDQRVLGSRSNIEKVILQGSVYFKKEIVTAVGRVASLGARPSLITAMQGMSSRFSRQDANVCTNRGVLHVIGSRMLDLNYGSILLEQGGCLFTLEPEVRSTDQDPLRKRSCYDLLADASFKKIILIAILFNDGDVANILGGNSVELNSGIRLIDFEPKKIWDGSNLCGTGDSFYEAVFDMFTSIVRTKALEQDVNIAIDIEHFTQTQCVGLIDDMINDLRLISTEFKKTNGSQCSRCCCAMFRSVSLKDEILKAIREQLKYTLQVVSSLKRDLDCEIKDNLTQREKLQIPFLG